MNGLGLLQGYHAKTRSSALFLLRHLRLCERSADDAGRWRESGGNGRICNFMAFAISPNTYLELAGLPECVRGRRISQDDTQFPVSSLSVAQTEGDEASRSRLLFAAPTI